MSAVATGFPDDIVALGDRMAALKADQARSLREYLKDSFGIEAPDTGVAFTDAPTTTIIEKVEEQTIFDIHLKSVDPAKKIAVIKIVRAATGLGLAESKALVEAAPKLVKEALPKADAEKLKKEIEDAGGVVEMK